MKLFKYTRGVQTKRHHGMILKSDQRSNIVMLDTKENRITELLSRCQDQGYMFKFIMANDTQVSTLEVRNLNDLNDNYMVIDTDPEWLEAWVGTGAENPSAKFIKDGYRSLVKDLFESKMADKSTYSGITKE